MRNRATGWVVLLVLGALTLLPGCPFFTRRDPGDAPTSAAGPAPGAAAAPADAPAPARVVAPAPAGDAPGHEGHGH